MSVQAPSSSSNNLREDSLALRDITLPFGGQTARQITEKNEKKKSRKKLICVGLVCLLLGALIAFLPTYLLTRETEEGGINITADPETDEADGEVAFSQSKYLATVSVSYLGESCTVAADEVSVGCTSSTQMASYRTNSKGLTLLKRFEGWRSRFYVDPVGITTIGYGYACHANSCSGGVFSKGYLTKEEGEQLLEDTLIPFEACVRDNINVALNENQFSALASFAFNVGCGNFRSSTLRAVLNLGQYDQIRYQLSRWVKGGGKTLPGLVTRRAAEADLFEDTVCDSTSITVTNRGGTCRHITSCSGTSLPGYCAGPTEIQCCVGEENIGDTCDIGGTTGVCQLESDCDGTLSSNPACTGSSKCCVKEQPKAPTPTDYCVTNDDRSGSCMDTSLCDGGRESVSGLCPGAASIQCCVEVEGPSCIAYGMQGKCMSSSTCNNGVGSPIPGFCSGPSDIQCCVAEIQKVVSGASCVSGGVQGGCMDTSSCTGPSIPGHCPGPSNIQCCLPDEAETTCQVGGVTGRCVDTTECAGSSTPGFCPGASNIQCCTPKAASIPCTGLGREESFDAYRRGSYIGRIQTVKIQGKWVEKNTACAFLRMEAAYGSPLQLNSGFRTMSEQTYLWNCYQTKRCNNGNLAARPGYSNHQNGIALDISSRDYAYLAANAHRFGFIRTVVSERWHWEYRPGQPRASYT